MKGRLNLLILAVVAGAILSCSKDDYVEENDLSKKLVVEAYVYADEPITHVKVSKVHNEGEAFPIPLSTANITISQGSNSFSLSPHPTEAGMYIQNDTSNLIEGTFEDISLNINDNGQSHVSTTVMPKKVENINVSNYLIDILPGDTSQVVAVVSWDEIEETSGYCVFIRTIDDDAKPISTYPSLSDNRNPFLIVNENNSVELKSAHFSHFGEYEIYVTAVNKEYLSIYTNNSDASLGSHAPSNIQNGWGVFTAFNGESLTITVQ